MNKQEQYAKLAELTAQVAAASNAAISFAKENDLPLEGIWSVTELATSVAKSEDWRYSAEHWNPSEDWESSGE